MLLMKDIGVITFICNVNDEIMALWHLFKNLRGLLQGRLFSRGC